MSVQADRDLLDLRGKLGENVLVTMVQAREEIRRPDGSEVPISTWYRWLHKCGWVLDEQKPDLSLATYNLMRCLAFGYSIGMTCIGRARLVGMANQIVGILTGEPLTIGNSNSYRQVRDLAERQACQQFSTRYHELKGLTQGNAPYSKAQTLELLSNYPSVFHNVKSN